MSLICIFQIIMYFQVYLILFYLGFARKGDQSRWRSEAPIAGNRAREPVSSHPQK
jgi:hypothetical protein